MHHVISTNNLKYLSSILAIYLIGYLIRQKLPQNNDEQLGETGLFLFSAVIFAYILQITGFDTTLSAFIPDQVIIGAAGVYILLLVRELIGYDGRILGFIFMFCLIYLTEVYRIPMEEFLTNNRWVIDLVLGVPLVYLTLQITGLVRFNNFKP